MLKRRRLILFGENGMHFPPPPPPPPTEIRYIRITNNGDIRATNSGNIRVTNKVG